MSDDVTASRRQGERAVVVDDAERARADKSAAGSRNVPLPVVDDGEQPVVLAGSLRWQLWVWPLLALVAVGVGIWDVLTGLIVLAGLLLIMATLRAFESPQGRCVSGSRSRWFDVTVLILSGVAIATLSLTIPSISW